MSVIYHYCDVNAFLNIIQHKKLWLSATNNLNDYNEINYFLDKALNRIIKSVGQDYYYHFQEFWQDRMLNLQTPYICSFSKKGDSLSQWRAYANDGKGFAIGFDRKSFAFDKNIPAKSAKLDKSIGIRDVNYDQKKEEQCIEYCIELLHKAFQNKQPNQDSILAAYTLNDFALFSKSDAFYEEDEVRMVHIPQIQQNPQNSELDISKCTLPLKHRVSNDIITSYFEYDFSSDSESSAIKEIYLGPKCNVTYYDLNLILASANLQNIKIKKSKASYR